jgi:hypothetical protein
MSATHSAKRELIQQLKEHFESEVKDAPSPEAAKSSAQALLMYRFLPVREADDIAAPGSLLEIATETQPRTDSQSSRRSWVLIVPSHGGLVTAFQGAPVQVVTPQSPLGELLLGCKAGESRSLESSSGTKRTYRILSIS